MGGNGFPFRSKAAPAPFHPRSEALKAVRAVLRQRSRWPVICVKHTRDRKPRTERATIWLGASRSSADEQKAKGKGANTQKLVLLLPRLPDQNRGLDRADSSRHLILADLGFPSEWIRRLSPRHQLPAVTVEHRRSSSVHSMPACPLAQPQTPIGKYQPSTSRTWHLTGSVGERKLHQSQLSLQLTSTIYVTRVRLQLLLRQA